MPAPTLTTPVMLKDPGYLWIAPLGTAEPTTAVAASKFSDTLPVAWIPFGATADGSTFSYSTKVEAITVAEFIDPVTYSTTERSGSIAFALANWSLSNFQRALNGGVAALTPTGTGATTMTTFQPPAAGAEVRCMLIWESTDATVRILFRQCIQGGEVKLDFQKAPKFASIPCTYNLEMPVGSTQPWQAWTAGVNRV